MKLFKYSIWLSAFIIVCSMCSRQVESQEEVPVVVHAHQTITVGKGPDALFLTPDGSHLYIANVEDEFISVIDTRTQTVVDTIRGTKYPWGFTRLGATNLVAVSGWDKGIDVIDVTSNTIVKSKTYPFNFGGITSSKDGSELFVVATEVNRVIKVDAQTLEIVDEYETGNGPDGIGISKDGSNIYVTNTKDGNISIIGLETKSTKLIQTGGKPELIHYNHDNSLLFISNFFGNKVHILNTETNKIVHDITGLDGPEEAVLSHAEDRLFIVNFNSSKVFSYDAATYEKRPEEFQVGAKPIGVMASRNDSVLYVTNYGDNSVSVIRAH